MELEQTEQRRPQQRLLDVAISCQSPDRVQQHSKLIELVIRESSWRLLLYLGGEEPHVVQICQFFLAAIDGKILKTWLAHFGPFALMAESMAFAFHNFDHNLHFDVIRICRF